MNRRSSGLRLLGALPALALAACAARAPAPTAGTSQGTPPDLRGSRVMVLPVQQVFGVRGDADAELAFGLRARGSGISWILPPRLREVVQRSPGMNLSITGLSVGAFSSAEVRRVGDPLFGELLRLGTLVDAGVALIPLSMVTQGAPEGQVVVHASLALIHVRTGRVLWYGVVAGHPGPVDDPRVLASAVDALARTLLWYSPG